MNDEVLERITLSGLNGIKKVELKKTLGKNGDHILQALIDKEQIFVAKKGAAYFVWTTDNYIAYLSHTDPKFKIIFNRISGASSENKIREHPNKSEAIKTSQQNIINSESDFKAEFDIHMIESSTSIGWAPFSEIRKKICESKKISTENFYSLATDLVERHREKYEVSSGGQEGIIMRGLVHGYVRNV